MTRPATGLLPDVATLPRWLQAELRSNHAGETGAVWIYRGVLRFSRDEQIREFARTHLVTEEEHLSIFESWLAPQHTSALIAAWRLSGWVLGALSILGGKRGVYTTIEAVETFVVSHYQQQLERMPGGSWPEIRAVLERCMQDEAEHRDDAASRKKPALSLLQKLWWQVVSVGSEAAVVVARRI